MQEIENFNLKNVDAVLFDFDYTLADSSKGVKECINYALQKLSIPFVSDETLFKTVGLSLQETFKCLSGEEDQFKASEFERLFVEKADVVMADLTEIYEEIPDFLEWLKVRNIKMGIVSTKFRYRIKSILSREKLLDLFSIIIGGEDVMRKKPDPEGLLLAIKKLNVSPSRTLYVGDSVVDAETANRASIPFIAVLTGVTSMEEFAEYSTLGVIDRVNGLYSLENIDKKR